MSSSSESINVHDEFGFIERPTEQKFTAEDVAALQRIMARLAVDPQYKDELSPKDQLTLGKFNDGIRVERGKAGEALAIIGIDPTVELPPRNKQETAETEDV